MNKLNIDYKKYIETMTEKDLVIVDPPWLYDNKKSRLLRYDLFTNNEKDLSYIFKNIKAKYVFLWVTNSFLINVFKANTFDFEYKTIITWKKLTAKGKIFYGLGSYFRNCTEHLVVYKRKNEKALKSSIRNLVEAEAKRRTEKPHIFECQILDIFIKKGMTNFSYIFSGLNVECFNSYNIDLVDISHKI